MMFGAGLMDCSLSARFRLDCGTYGGVMAGALGVGGNAGDGGADGAFGFGIFAGVRGCGDGDARRSSPGPGLGRWA